MEKEQHSFTSSIPLMMMMGLKGCYYYIVVMSGFFLVLNFCFRILDTMFLVNYGLRTEFSLSFERYLIVLFIERE